EQRDGSGGGLAPARPGAGQAGEPAERHGVDRQGRGRRAVRPGPLATGGRARRRPRPRARAEGGRRRGRRGARQGDRRDPRGARRANGGLIMAQLTIEVNGRPYLVGCEDGQESQLRELAKVYDAYVRQLSGEVGQLGETRLFLMGALLMADELQDVRTRLAHTQAELNRLRTERDMLENKAAAALDAAAKRVEALAGGGPAAN